MEDNELKSQDKQLDDNCACGKEKRYCKGCLCDVTESMFCYCGELPLSNESTYTDKDLEAMNI